MTEQEARQVLLLQSHESPAGAGAGDWPSSALVHGHGASLTPARGPHAAHGSPLWSAEDRSWATRQAVAVVGDAAGPQRFVVARAAIALQRLLPRDPAGQRWLGRRAWQPAWVAVALVLGLLGGLAVDQLGPPQRVNLLAPAVWAVVAWNLAVYLALLLPNPLPNSLPSPLPGLRDGLARWALRGSDTVQLLWARHAAPLTGARLALLLHSAAAGLALGLMAGLYLRGLVLDYRAGWQSTFLDALTVQQVLDLLLKPASALSGIAVPDVAPLRVGPGGDATATAAPWIHLLATTVALAVLMPRTLLAWRAAARARGLARDFPLPLDTPYFESLHPLMRPGLTPTVRLLWVPLVDATAALPRLFGVDIGTLQTLSSAPSSARLPTPLTLIRSDEGDELQLHPVPPGVQGAVVPAAAPGPWWLRWRAPGPGPLQRLREQVDVVLLLTRPGQALPDWLNPLARPLIVLVDTPEAEPPRLSLHALADGWLADGRLLLALEAALPNDPRLPRLRAAWVARQAAQLDEGVQLVADSLARIAATHQPVADEGFLARRAEAEAARTALAGALDGEWLRFEAQLAARFGPAADTDAAGGALSSRGHANAQVRARLGEGRAALVGGVVTGALAGLKADVLSGGLTMGAGALAGGVLGALGAAGMARGLNVVRGTDRSFASWNEDALAPITAALLQRYLVRAHGLAPASALQALTPALARQQGTLATLWRSRERALANGGEAEQLARTLHPLLRETVQAVLGEPARP